MSGPMKKIRRRNERSSGKTETDVHVDPRRSLDLDAESEGNVTEELCVMHLNIACTLEKLSWKWFTDIVQIADNPV